MSRGECLVVQEENCLNTIEISNHLYIWRCSNFIKIENQERLWTWYYQRPEEMPYSLLMIDLLESNFSILFFMFRPNCCTMCKLRIDHVVGIEVSTFKKQTTTKNE